VKKLKMGTAAMGIFLGCVLAAAGALAMLIGFWRVLLLACLFGIGYFIGTIDNVGRFVKDNVNKLIPDKSAQPINIKDQLTREENTQGTGFVYTFDSTENAETEDAGE